MAVGIYLPLQLSTAILLGGLIAWAATRYFDKRGGDENVAVRKARTVGERHGLLFAAGLITGEALLGILLAIPIVVVGSADALAFWGVHTGSLPGMILLAIVMIALYRVVTGAVPQEEE